MNIGDMDQFCVIQSFTETGKTRGGEPVGTWGKFIDGWFEKKWKSGGEKIMGEQITGYQVNTFTGHFQSGVTQSMRLVHGSDTYDILDVLPVKQNLMMIICQKHD